MSSLLDSSSAHVGSADFVVDLEGFEGPIDLLLSLARGRVQLQHGPRNYDEQFHWLYERTDPASYLERQFLRRLYESERRLPDEAQPLLVDYPSHPDFIYRDARACVFCDGSMHDRNPVEIRRGLQQEPDSFAEWRNR